MSILFLIISFIKLFLLYLVRHRVTYMYCQCNCMNKIFSNRQKTSVAGVR